MSTVLWVVSAIVVVFVAVGLILVTLIVRETWGSRHECAKEDQEAGEDERRGATDKDWWAGW
jgi:hypothetical protein